MTALAALTRAAVAGRMARWMTSSQLRSNDRAKGGDECCKACM